MNYLLIFILSLFWLTSPTSVSAHAFGALYTLPIPLWLYLFGGGAALIVSFLIIGFFTSTKHEFKFAEKLIKNKLLLKVLEFSLRFLKVLIPLFFLISIIAGFIGSPLPSENFAPNFFWIILLLGLTYLIGIFGNFWQFANPAQILSSLLFKEAAILNYSKKIAYWPGLLFYFLLIYIELLSGGLGTVVHILAILILVYFLITLFGCFLFGSQNYLKQADFFTIFFNIFGKIGIFRFDSKGKIYLRWPFLGLVTEKVDHFSLLLFILFMLSSTAFDGFRSSATWLKIYFNNLKFLENLFGDNGFLVAHITLLILSPFLFLSLYLLAVFLMKTLTKSKDSIFKLALEFGYSLVPIAFVYNIAHYYTLLFTQGQVLVGLLSDPFNLGWNLFGTADLINKAIILDAGFVWNSQVFFIILGHIAAVFLSHLIALHKFKSNKLALISQIPMLLLMVSYTVFGLWILSQPLGLR